MTQKVSSMSVASASCSGLQTEQSLILQRIAGGQPSITRFLGKISVIRLRNQTKMCDRCMEGRLQKGIRPPPVEPQILKAQAVPKALQTGLHPVPVGSPVVRKIQMAPLVAEMEIQAKPPNAAETKEMPKDPRARVKEIRLEPLLQARREVPHPASVAVEGQSSCGSGDRCRSGGRCRPGSRRKCLDSSR